MHIIDRYIIKSTIAIFISTMLIFCCLYILIDTASHLDEILDRNVPLQTLFHYYLAYLPIIFIHTSSIACLISVLFTFSHLNNHNEIIVLRTCGMNFWRITKPAIGFALLISALVFWINEQYVPIATGITEKIKNESLILKVDSDRKRREKIKNLTFYGVKNRLYHIDSFDPNTYELKGITIIGHDNDQNIREKIIASTGKWTGIAWKLFRCQIAYFQPDDIRTPVDINFYKEKLMDIKETPEDFFKQRLNVNSMNIRQLYNYILLFSGSGAIKALNNLKVDLHQKIAFPFGNIVIIMVGLPLAMISGRRKALAFTSMGIAVAIGFFFYVLNAVGLALGKGGALPPFLSAWISPFIFLSVALYLIKTKF